MTSNCIPTPVTDGKLCYAISGYRGAALLAIRLDAASGDITDSPAVAWKYDKDTPYVPSPVLTGERLYFTQNTAGILSCLNARTGEKLFGPERLPDIKGLYASLVAAKDRVYVVSRDGHTCVLKDGPTFEVLAHNVLDDRFDASPALVGRELFLRGEKNLYCLASP